MAHINSKLNPYVSEFQSMYYHPPPVCQEFVYEEDYTTHAEVLEEWSQEGIDMEWNHNEQFEEVVNDASVFDYDEIHVQAESEDFEIATSNNSCSGSPTPSTTSSKSSSPEVFVEELSLLQSMQDPEVRYSVIIDLCKKSDIIPNLAVYLWIEPGCIAVLICETVKLYVDIHPPNLSEDSINMICSIAALEQRIVLDPRTRKHFLNSGILNFWLPFLGMVGKSREVEQLRVCVLSLLLTATHKESIEDVYSCLEPSQNDLVRLVVFCLTESISEVGRSMALKILLNFLIHDDVLDYLCQSYERFRELLWGLGRLVIRMEQKFIADFSDNSKRVFKYIISTFMRISDHEMGKEALLHCIPTELFDGRFYLIFSGDSDVQDWLSQLFERLFGSHSGVEDQTNNNSCESAASSCDVIGQHTHSAASSSASLTSKSVVSDQLANYVSHTVNDVTNNNFTDYDFISRSS